MFRYHERQETYLVSWAGRGIPCIWLCGVNWLIDWLGKSFYMSGLFEFRRLLYWSWATFSVFVEATYAIQNLSAVICRNIALVIFFPSMPCDVTIKHARTCVKLLVKVSLSSFYGCVNSRHWICYVHYTCYKLITTSVDSLNCYNCITEVAFRTLLIWDFHCWIRDS